MFELLNEGQMAALIGGMGGILLGLPRAWVVFAHWVQSKIIYMPIVRRVTDVGS